MLFHNLGQLLKINGFVCVFDHANSHALVNTFLVSVRRQGDNSALVLSAMIFHYFDNFSGSIESIHDWHLYIHENKFVMMSTSALLKEVILKHLNRQKSIMRFITLNIEGVLNQGGERH